jgi:hypothetical protein
MRRLQLVKAVCKIIVAFEEGFYDRELAAEQIIDLVTAQRRPVVSAPRRASSAGPTPHTTKGART